MSSYACELASSSPAPMRSAFFGYPLECYANHRLVEAEGMPWRGRKGWREEIERLACIVSTKNSQTFHEKIKTEAANRFLARANLNYLCYAL